MLREKARMGSKMGGKAASMALALREARRTAHTVVKAANMSNQQLIIPSVSSSGSVKAGSCVARIAGSVVCAPDWRIEQGGVRFLCVR